MTLSLALTILFKILSIESIEETKDIGFEFEKTILNYTNIV